MMLVNLLLPTHHHLQTLSAVMETGIRGKAAMMEILKIEIEGLERRIRPLLEAQSQ